MCWDALVWLLCMQGKGANTPFILESRGLQRSETMSSLLERNPDIRDLMNQGELVPDTMVGLPCWLQQHHQGRWDIWLCVHLLGIRSVGSASVVV